jgi:hypothetical protein
LVRSARFLHDRRLLIFNRHFTRPARGRQPIRLRAAQKLGSAFISFGCIALLFCLRVLFVDMLELI